MIDELLVFVAGRLAGVARRRAAPDRHLVAFRYDNAYIAGTESTPLSLGMPVAATEYEISRWLDGLLPDKRDVRVEWAQQQGAQAVEPVSMLATPIGLDCAGAVQFCQPGEEEVVSDRGSGVEWHTDTEIAAWVRKAKQGQRAPSGPAPLPPPSSPLSPGGTRPLPPTSSGSVVCGAPLGPGRSCSRKLLSRPCPQHPRSSGSKRINSRNKRR